MCEQSEKVDLSRQEFKGNSDWIENETLEGCEGRHFQPKQMIEFNNLQGIKWLKHTYR